MSHSYFFPTQDKSCRFLMYASGDFKYILSTLRGTLAHKARSQIHSKKSGGANNKPLNKLDLTVFDQ